MNFTTFLYTAPEKIVFLYCKLFNKKETADEYDDMFMSGCNSIVCLNRRLNRRLNVGRTSQWYILIGDPFLPCLPRMCRSLSPRVEEYYDNLMVLVPSKPAL